MKEIEAYRIVEEKGGEFYTLFHGFPKEGEKRNTRKLPKGVWLKAQVKTVSDGSSGTKYKSGFHILTSKEETEVFFRKLFRIHKNRRIIKVLARGLRPKSHSRHKVFLADELFVLEEQ